MKHLRTLSVLILALVISGCASINLLDELAADANLAAYIGASVDIADNPERKPFYAASVSLLDSLIRDENYEPAAFMAALTNLPVKELKGSKSTLIVGSAVALWNRAAARIDINKSELVKRVAPAVRDGLRRAVAEAQ